MKIVQFKSDPVNRVLGGSGVAASMCHVTWPVDDGSEITIYLESEALIYLFPIQLLWGSIWLLVSDRLLENVPNVKHFWRFGDNMVG